MDNMIEVNVKFPKKSIVKDIFSYRREPLIDIPNNINTGSQSKKIIEIHVPNYIGARSNLRIQREMIFHHIRPSNIIYYSIYDTCPIYNIIENNKKYIIKKDKDKFFLEENDND